jgi:hypothetical protein
VKTVRNTEPERIDFCQSTNVPVPVRKLVWSKRKYMLPQANNHLLYSEYNTSAYNSTADDAGLISIGRYADNAVVHRDMAGAASYTGVQTWSGSGTIALDAPVTSTGWTAACFSVTVGPYHRETSPGGTVTISILNGVDDSVIAAKSFSFLGPRTIYVGTAVSNASLNVSVAVTAAGKWYVERMSLERDVLVPGVFAPTAGQSVNRSADVPTFCISMIHEDEVERVVEDWETHGIPRGDPHYPTVNRQSF